MSQTSPIDEPGLRKLCLLVGILMGVLTLFFMFLVYGGYVIAGVPFGLSILFILASRVGNPRTSKVLAFAGAVVILLIALIVIGFKVRDYLARRAEVLQVDASVYQHVTPGPRHAIARNTRVEDVGDNSSGQGSRSKAPTGAPNAKSEPPSRLCFQPGGLVVSSQGFVRASRRHPR